MYNCDAIISVTEIETKEIQSDIIRDMYNKCRRWRQNKPVLLRRDLRPQEVSSCLSHVAIINYLPDAEKMFQVSLVGEEITNRALGYCSGAYIEDVTPNYYSQNLLTYYQRTVDDARMKAELVVWDFFGRILPLERILVPLVNEEDGPVSSLLVATHRHQKTLQYMEKSRNFEAEDTGGIRANFAL